MAVKIEIVGVGKLSAVYFKAAADEYLKRLSRFATVNVIELKESAAADKEQRVKQESDCALERMKGEYVNVVLDRGASEQSSEAMSRSMFRVFESGKGIRFFIGGSEGFSEEVKKKADKLLGFGEATFPHQLMRVMLLEQIYRAFKIREGSKYHK